MGFIEPLMYFQELLNSDATLKAARNEEVIDATASVFHEYP